MFNFFLPSKTKKVLAESELIQGSLQRNRIYAQDILSAKDLEIDHGAGGALSGAAQGAGCRWPREAEQGSR